MIFTSLTFIYFFALIFIIYYVVPFKYQKYVLLIASIVFYGMYGYKALLQMLLSAILGYCGALLVRNTKKLKVKKILFTVIVVLELGILALTKYVLPTLNVSSIVIPIGISFYTLSIIGYIIDVYREKYPAEGDFFKFDLYVNIHKPKQA